MDKMTFEYLRKTDQQTKKTQICLLIGLCNVYRRLIEDFTGMAHPLEMFLKKGTPDFYSFKISN